ncbi:MAG TPA: Omp28-related outer membrane protein [Flavobacteriales bacterium]|nr:Omp28-related outer membrane protein [Flavobacteriales bacterium]
MKRTVPFFILIASLIAGSDVSAQAVKYVLFEHWTGASCPPCAAQNPGFQNDILGQNLGSVHHIAYHTEWPPPADPMNVYNAAEVASRVNYYGVTSVPTIQMTGKLWKGQPAGVTQSLVNNEIVKNSPIRVAVTETSDGTDRNVKVVVHSIGTPPVGTFVLRVAVVEREIIYGSPPGTNGEKEFPNVFRKMLPNTTGEAYTPAAMGDSVTFNFTYTLDQGTWDTTQIYSVAFVQEEISGEVINSGTASDPDWGIISTTSHVAQTSPGNLSTFSASLFNSDNASGNYRIHFTKNHPVDWSAEFTFNSTAYIADSVDVVLAANSTESINFNITTGITSGVGDYLATLTSLDDPTLDPKVFEFHLVSGVSDLIVNNAAGIGDGSGGDASNWESDYENGLIYAGSSTYGITDHLVLVQAFKQNALGGVRNIYLNIGWTFPSFNDELIAELTTFLDAGGRLFVAGQDIGWDVWDVDGYGTPAQKTFYTNYMGANYIDDIATVPNDSMVFNSGDAIFGTTGNSDILKYYGTSPYYPDQIEPLVGAQTIYYYNSDTNNIGGVRHESGLFRVVYLGVGLEMVGDVNIRNEIIKTSYDWFWDGVISAPEWNASESTVKVFPNPFGTSTNVMFNLKERTELIISLHDITGRQVYQVNKGIVNKGRHIEAIDGSGFPAGVYFLRLAMPDGVMNEKVIVTR